MARKSLLDMMATPGDRDWLASSGPAGKPGATTVSPAPFGTHRTVLMGDDGMPASNVPFVVGTDGPEPVPMEPIKGKKARAKAKPKPVVAIDPDWGTW